MTKKEVSQRVLLNGKPLSEDFFTWDELTNTFSTYENNLILDFRNISNCTFKTGSNCTFKTGSNCTFKTGSNCTFDTDYNCTFNTGSNCTFKTGYDCTFETDYDCTFDTRYNCTFNTGSNCTFNTGSDCKFKTDSDCTFDTRSNCTFNTGSFCTFKTGSNCTFETSYDCIFRTSNLCMFETGSNCTFNTGYGCTFNMAHNCVIVRRDKFEVIIKPRTPIKLCPVNIDGYLIQKEDGKWYKDDVEHVLIDGILSQVVNRRGNVYRVINHGKTDETYIVTDGTNYAHGETIKEARESLIYKVSDRDTTEYNGLTIDSEITFEDAIKMYRKITGACEGGVKGFITTLPGVKKSYTIGEIIEITDGSYGHSLFKNFFTKK